MVSDETIVEAVEKQLKPKKMRRRVFIRINEQEEAILKEAQAIVGAKRFSIFLRACALVGASAIIKDKRRRKGLNLG